jgi:hypothetical protein
VRPVGGRDYDLTSNCAQRLIADYKCHLTFVNHKDFRVRVHVKVWPLPGRRVDQEEGQSDSTMVSSFE